MTEDLPPREKILFGYVLLVSYLLGLLTGVALMLEYWNG